MLSPKPERRAIEDGKGFNREALFRSTAVSLVGRAAGPVTLASTAFYDCLRGASESVLYVARFLFFSCGRDIP